MKSDLETMKSKISTYEGKVLEYEQKNEMERANRYLTRWNIKIDKRRSLESRIDEGELSELRVSMSKKARMIQEGMVDANTCIFVIVINLHFILAFGIYHHYC